MKKIIIYLITFISLINFNISHAFASTNIVSEINNTHKAVVTLDGDSDASDAKNPLAAFGLSFLIPGAGQVYNGEILKGLLIFAGVVGLASLEIFFARPRIALAESEDKRADSLIELISLIDKVGIFSLWVYGWGDAYRSASPEYQLQLKEKKDNTNQTSNNIVNFNFYSIRF